jgi:hypothetical protein
MKEIDNIQVPVKVDIRQLVDTYGSHYEVNVTKESDMLDSMFHIKEVIGKKDTLNDWKHEYATVEEARHAACNSIEIVKRKLIEEHEDIESTIGWKMCQFFSWLGLSSDRNKREYFIFYQRLAELKQEVERLKDKSAHIDLVFMKGEYNIPSNMPELGKTYYMLNINDFTNIKLTPMTLIPEEVAIYDYRGSSSNDKFADQFDFKFSHYFEGPNGESTMIDTDRLVRFNGQYWNLGIMNYYLFVDEKEALVFAKKCAENKVSRMQAELISINESMTKL